jgi:mannitol-1-/sugar-/sorbitol-6-phosphatase
MTEISCGGVLFDLDGVLVDSTPAVTRVWAQWAAKHALVSEEVVRRAHGRPSIETIRELLPHADHAQEDRDVERGEIADLDGVVPLPGAVEVLQGLPADRWAIVTSCTPQLAQARIAAARLPVPRQIVTAGDIRRGKPDPEPYLKGAQKLGLEVAGCVVVEDAPAGVRSGKAAGARVIAVRTTTEEAELIAAGADWIVKDLSALQLADRDGNHQLRLVLLA